MLWAQDAHHVCCWEVTEVLQHVNSALVHKQPLLSRACRVCRPQTTRLSLQDRIGQREGDLYRQARQALHDGGSNLGQMSAVLPWQQKQLTELQGEQQRHTQERQQQQEQQHESEAREAEQRAEAAERNQKDAAARQVCRCSAFQWCAEI